MPTIRIHCDGGLGNRFGPVVDGLLFAERSGYTPLIHWPTNMNCAAGLGDLFEYVPAEYSENLPPVDWPLVGHITWKGRTCFDTSEIDKMTGDFEYTDNGWKLSDEEGKRILSKFKILPSIMKRVNDFCTENGIDKHCTGIHIRATDNLSINQINNAHKLIKSSGKVFLCCDEKEIEDGFAHYSNVVLRPKDFYVEKIVPGGWRIKPPPDEPYKCYNVNRTKESVIDAFIDLLVLSRTSFNCSSSSFCRLGKML